MRFDDCEIPEREIGNGRMLASIQTADLFGDEAELAAARLVTVILRLLGTEAPAAPGSPLTRPEEPAQAGLPTSSTSSMPPTAGPRQQGPWNFGGETAITIVCAELPQHMVDQMPYSNPASPHYTEDSGYADRDSLGELRASLPGLSPRNPINYCTPSMLTPEDYQSHLVAVGGIDFNEFTANMLRTLRLPVRQIADWDAEGGQYFEVTDNVATTRYRAVFDRAGDQNVLREDVALFARAPSPFRRGCTITICCGMHTPGTLGVVRAVTDKRVRNSNIDFLCARFRGNNTYVVLTRITVTSGRCLTPDWTLGENILYTWPD